MVRLLNKFIFSGLLNVLTGIHIGGNKESFEIGGMDNPIIRDPITNLPYIPGSSIKGKMRSELEWRLGVVNEDPKVVVSKDYRIVDLFGLGADKMVVRADSKETKKDRPTRLIVRDAYPQGYEALSFNRSLREQIESDKLKHTTIGLWNKLDMGLSFTEWKKENTINRISGEANPRDMERIPAGSRFVFEFVLIQFEGDDLETLLENFKTAVCLVEDSSLGGSGSRGYGKVRFQLDHLEVHNPDYYRSKVAKGDDTLMTHIGEDYFRTLDVKAMVEQIAGKG